MILPPIYHVTVLQDITSLPNMQFTTFGLNPLGGSYSTVLDSVYRLSVNIMVVVDPEGLIAESFFEQAVAAQLFVPGRAWILLSDVEEIPSWLPQGAIFIQRSEATPANVTAFTTYVAAQDSAKYPGFGTEFSHLYQGSLLTYDSVIAFAEAVDSARLVAGDGGASGVSRKDLNNSLSKLGASSASSAYPSFSDIISFEANGFRKTGFVELWSIMNGTTLVPELSMTYDTQLLKVKEPIWPGRSHVVPDDQTDNIPVAFMLDFSGGNATPFQTEALKYAMQYAITRINAMPNFLPSGKQLCPILLDDETKPSVAVTHAVSLEDLAISGVIGGMSSSISIVVQDVVSAWNIPQVSPSASAPQLSYKEQYPTFSRVCSTALMEGDIVVSLAKQFKWTELSIISTLDAYGSAAAQDLLTHAADNDITIHEHLVVDPYLHSYDVPLQRLKNAEPRVLIMMVGIESIQNVLRSMVRINLTTVATVASDSLALTNLTRYANSIGIPSDYFEGWLTLGQPGGSGLVWEAFEDELAALDTSEWPGVADIVGSSPIIVSTFDAVQTLANAIVACFGNAPCDPRNGTELLPYIRSVNFTGLTGSITMTDVGDRTGTFEIRNVLGGQQIVVGSYYSPGEHGDVHLTNTRIVWPDGTTTIPLAIAPRTPTWLKWNSPAGIVLSLVAALGIGFAILMMTVIYWQRESPVIVSSTWQFLILMLCGAVLGMGSVWVWIGEPSPHLCALRIWIPPIAFTLILTPLLAKTWRLVRIFSLATFKVEPIPLSTLVIIVGALTFVQIIICIVWISLGTIQIETVIDLHSKDLEYVVCKTNNANKIASYVTYGYNGLLIFISCYLAFRVRKLPKDFNESRWIVRTIYNTLLFAVLIIILGYSLSSFISTVLILICVCTLGISIGTVLFIMLPKAWELFVHPERRSSSSGFSGDSTRATTQGGRSYPSKWSKDSTSKDSHGSFYGTSVASPETQSTDSNGSSRRITDYSRNSTAEAKRRAQGSSVSLNAGSPTTTPTASPTTSPQTKRRSVDGKKKLKTPPQESQPKAHFEESISDEESAHQTKMKPIKTHKPTPTHVDEESV